MGIKLDITNFEQGINEAERELSKGPFSNTTINYSGVCVALKLSFTICGSKTAYNVVRDFNNFYKPDNPGRIYWLGDLCKENVEKRRKVLRGFEAFIIAEGLYKNY